MSGDKPKKVDPAYPSSDGLSRAGDAAMGTLGAAAGLVVPVVGPAVVQAILKKAVQTPLELRRANWFNLIGEGLRELQDRFDGFDPDRLGENEEFVSVVAETTRIAMATHRAEKLEALRAAVLNTAVGIQLDDVLRGSFLGYVEQFSALHLKVLRVLADPSAFPGIVMRVQTMSIGSLEHVLPLGVPEIGDNTLLLERVVADLEREGLVSSSGLRGMMSGSGLLVKRTSEFGDAFLRFITDPQG